MRAYLGVATYRTLEEPELRRYLDPWLGEVGQAAFYRQVAQMDDRYTDAIQDRLGELRCPVTILWGAQDAWIPLERAHDLAGRIPGARLRVVDDAGHLVQEDSPESVVATVLEVLDAVPA